MSRYFTFCRFFAITATLILLSGCKAPQTIYVPVRTTDSTADVHHDTQREKDSIIIERNTIIREADSALLAQLGIMGVKVADNERLLLVLQQELTQKSQQLNQSKSDTVTKYEYEEVPMPYPVEKEVVKPLTWWQRTQIYGFWVLVLVVACWVLIRKVAYNLRT